MERSNFAEDFDAVDQTPNPSSFIRYLLNKTGESRGSPRIAQMQSLSGLGDQFG